MMEMGQIEEELLEEEKWYKNKTNETLVKIHTAKILYLIIALMALSAFVVYQSYRKNTEEPIPSDTILHLLLLLAAVIMISVFVLLSAETFNFKLLSVGDGWKTDENENLNENVGQIYFSETMKKEQLKLLNLFRNKALPAVKQKKDLWSFYMQLRCYSGIPLFLLLLACSCCFYQRYQETGDSEEPWNCFSCVCLSFALIPMMIAPW